VRAPVPGVVGEVTVRVGDYVDASTLLTTLSQTKTLELNIGVPADRARALAISAPVEVLARDGRVVAQSTVFFIAREAEPSTQLVEVKASIANETGLRTSELVRARVVFSTHRALQLPLAAVVRQSGQTFAFVVADKDGQTVVERRPVELGPLGETAYQVESGLGPGDRVAISSVQSLRDGVAIVPVVAQPDDETVAHARVPPPRRAADRGGS
jgi:RND family efflux transporter MFP subunit